MKRTQKAKYIVLSAVGGLLALLLLAVYVLLFFLPQKGMKEAQQLMSQGDYTGACAVYERLTDSTVLGLRLSELPFGSARLASFEIAKCDLAQGEALIEQGQYKEAAAVFARVADSAPVAQAAAYCRGCEALIQADFEDAIDLFAQAGGYRDAAALAEQATLCLAEEMQKNASPFRQAGQVVPFGAYEQDGNAENGKEPLLWRVLTAGDNHALLIAQDVIDCRPYNSDFTVVTWESCSLREWLNSGFSRDAFDDEQKRALMPIPRSEKSVSRFGPIADATANDLVTLLGTDDIAMYREMDEILSASPTAYAALRGAAADEAGRAPWWLRMDGYESDDALAMQSDVSRNVYVTTNGIGVRPVICVDLTVVKE